MAITDKKRRFAAALKSGASQTEAAIASGYSKNGAAQAGSRLAKDPDVIAELARKEHVAKAKEEAKEKGREINLPDLSKMYSDPMDFLMAMMNDAAEDLRIRHDAAKTLMPYRHARKDAARKKEDKQNAARKVASRFSTSAPPRLVANQGRKV